MLFNRIRLNAKYDNDSLSVLFIWSICSYNPFIYCWLNKNFRKAALRVFCCCCVSSEIDSANELIEDNGNALNDRRHHTGLKYSGKRLVKHVLCCGSDQHQQSKRNKKSSESQMALSAQDHNEVQRIAEQHKHSNISVMTETSVVPFYGNLVDEVTSIADVSLGKSETNLDVSPTQPQSKIKFQKQNNSQNSSFESNGESISNIVPTSNSPNDTMQTIVVQKMENKELGDKQIECNEQRLWKTGTSGDEVEFEEEDDDDCVLNDNEEYQMNKLLRPKIQFKQASNIEMHAIAGNNNSSNNNNITTNPNKAPTANKQNQWNQVYDGSLNNIKNNANTNDSVTIGSNGINSSKSQKRDNNNNNRINDIHTTVKVFLTTDL